MEQPRRAASNGVSTKDHLEAIIVRLEASVRDQVAELRNDIKLMQSNFVSRAEHDLVTQFLKSEIARTEDEHRKALKDQDEARERTTARLIAVASLVAGFVTTAIQVGAQFLK
jgi:hypothetical protein